MTLKVAGPLTRLQSASRRLAESRALLAQHSIELMVLREAGYCVRETLAVHHELRERVAQSHRDVIWAQDRIRFGLDPPAVLAALGQSSGTAGGGRAQAAEQELATTANRTENASSKKRPGRRAA